MELVIPLEGGSVTDDAERAVGRLAAAAVFADDRLQRSGYNGVSLFVRTPLAATLRSDDGSEREVCLRGFTPYDPEGGDAIVVLVQEVTTKQGQRALQWAAEKRVESDDG